MAETPTPLAEIEHGPGKLEQFLDAHQKKLIILAILIALGVIAYVVVSGMKETAYQEEGSAFVKATELADYQDVVKNNPQGSSAGSAHVIMADLQWEESQQDSIETLQALLDNHPNHPATPAARIGLALRLLEQGKTKEAKDLLDIAANDDTASYLSPWAKIVLGDIAKTEGDIDKAVAFYKAAGGTNPPANSPPANAFADTASSRLAIARAAAPKKIQPAPPKPATPPSSVPGITPGDKELPDTPGEAPKLELPGTPSTPPTPPATPPTPPAGQ